MTNEAEKHTGSAISTTVPLDIGRAASQPAPPLDKGRHFVHPVRAPGRALTQAVPVARIRGTPGVDSLGALLGLATQRLTGPPMHYRHARPQTAGRSRAGVPAAPQTSGSGPGRATPVAAPASERSRPTDVKADRSDHVVRPPARDMLRGHEATDTAAEARSRPAPRRFVRAGCWRRRRQADTPVERRAEDGTGIVACITDEGLRAIGIDPNEGDEVAGERDGRAACRGDGLGTAHGEALLRRRGTCQRQ
jgi:hypothetical protein